MRVRLTVLTWILVGAALLASGCSKNASPPAEPAAGEAPPEAEVPESGRSAKLLPLPGESAQPSGPASRAPGLAWEVPEGWVEETPASSMRRAQYRVPGPGGDGECIVFYFGPGQGGDAAANAVRWAQQFKQPDGSSSVDRMQMAALEGARVPVQVVEVTGTYDGGMTMTDAPAERKAGYMLLGAIAQGADAPWFFKFTAPEATARAHRESFETMLRSIRAGN
jgi:hypothetical protein